jgi:hypothetical protein
MNITKVKSQSKEGPQQYATKETRVLFLHGCVAVTILPHFYGGHIALYTHLLIMLQPQIGIWTTWAQA